VTVTATSAVTAFTIGDRVKTTAAVNVRQNPSTGGKPGKQKTGALGTVILGPQTGSGYTWYKVDFDSGSDGWVVQNYLSR
jgi:hypothetical protein